MRTILVCGGRSFGVMPQDVRPGDPDYTLLKEKADREAKLIHATLDALGSEIRLVHGGSRGADTIAGHWASMRGIEVKVYFAEWSAYGRGAGPMRNEKMLLKEMPDLVIAFPGTAGTRDMKQRARAARVEVQEVEAP